MDAIPPEMLVAGVAVVVVILILVFFMGKPKPFLRSSGSDSTSPNGTAGKGSPRRGSCSLQSPSHRDAAGAAPATDGPTL